MQRSALGCGSPILLLGAQACVGWAGDSACLSWIAPTPRYVPAGEVTDEQAAARQVSEGWQRARAIALARCGLRTVAPPPPVCHTDVPAPLGSHQRAPRCRPPPERLAAPLTFVTAFGLRRPPHAQPGLCASQVPPTHLHLSHRCACASRIARTCIARLPRSAGRWPFIGSLAGSHPAGSFGEPPVEVCAFQYQCTVTGYSLS